METYLYVDVLLVINYIINTLLIHGAAKLTGRRPGRHRVAFAALFGAMSSLSIFLPFFGFWLSLGAKGIVSAVIVFIAFPYISIRQFGKQLFVFFAVSFFFAGVMLAIWMVFAPRGMLYYNGVVYFDVSSVTLIVTTAAAYILLSLGQRFSRKGRLAIKIYETEIFFRGRSVRLSALVDSGNSLTEPFSDIPVMVCGLADIAALLPIGAAECILTDGHMTGEFAARFDLPLRLIPYRGVKTRGAMPAFRPDYLLLSGYGETLRTESVYIGITPDAPKGEGYRAILNPDLIGLSIPVNNLQGGAVK
jgi:stage II sporulation protein GA (sporulation sigma-E factor processing peptidase)